MFARQWMWEAVVDNTLLVVAVCVIFALVIGGIVFRRVKSTRAAKQAQQFAAERNWRYVTSDSGVVANYPQLYPFYVSGRSTSRPGIGLRSGSADDCRDVLYFRSGEYPGQSFTYTYTTYDEDSDKSSNPKHHFWHIVGLELPIPFPNLILRRRRKIELPQARLTQPIELPSTELNSLYAVHSEHHPAALDLMTPEMIEWLVDGRFQNEMVMQDRHLFVFNKGRQKLENIDPMLAQLNGFLSRIPQEVWQKAQGTYPRPTRVQMVESLDLGKMKDAYNEWRETN